MENHILQIATTFNKSMVLREDELWVSSDKISSIEILDSPTDSENL